MNDIRKDCNLREAVNRRERQQPPLTDGVNERLLQRMQRLQENAPKPTSKPTRRAKYAYIAALAAAACIAFAVLMVWPTNGEPESEGSVLAVRGERTVGTTPVHSQSDSVVLVASNQEAIKNVDTESRVLPAKAAVHQAKRTDRQLVEQANTASAADSLDYYISKIERELASVDDSLYIERIHRVMHADERLQRIVNNYILNELHKDAQPHQATIINNVTTDDDEE